MPPVLLRGALVLAAFAAVAATGCGGSDGDSDTERAVRATAVAYAQATIAVDLPRACGLVVGLEDTVRRADARPAACEDVLANGANGSVRPTDRDLQRLRTGRVTVDGDRARIRLVGSDLPLRRTPAGWRVDFAAMRPGDVG